MKFLLFAAAIAASAQTIVVHADRLLDGKGKIVRNATVTIEGSKIVTVALRTILPLPSRRRSA